MAEYVDITLEAKSTYPPRKDMSLYDAIEKYQSNTAFDRGLTSNSKLNDLSKIIGVYIGKITAESMEKLNKVIKDAEDELFTPDSRDESVIMKDAYAKLLAIASTVNDTKPGGTRAYRKKFDTCVKTVRRRIKPRKGSNKESAAIAICTKSVLQTRGRTMKKYRKGKLMTQKF